VLLALVIRQCGVQAFTIPSGSMMDTLLVGDYILVNKFLYGAELPFTDAHLPGLRKPERGDIVVFKYPNDETRDFIKRIVAVGGDTVQVVDNRVVLNGHLIDEPYIRPGSIPSSPSTHCGYLYGCEPTVVPRGRTSSWATTGTIPRTAATGDSCGARRSAARPFSSTGRGMGRVTGPVGPASAPGFRRRLKRAHLLRWPPAAARSTYRKYGLACGGGGPPRIWTLLSRLPWCRDAYPGQRKTLS
jgi:signal peptidase I